MEKRHQGSCHCGAVRYEVTFDLSEGIRKCNCSFCFKMGYHKAFAYGDHLTVSAGEEYLGHYVPQKSNWPPGEVDHRFCGQCGTQVFSRGKLEMEPFNGWFHAINVATLDDVTPEELDAAPIIYEDGLHDRQQERPALVGYL